MLYKYDISDCIKFRTVIALIPGTKVRNNFMKTTFLQIAILKSNIKYV